MQMKSITHLKIIYGIVLFSLLAGCGFHLQGTFDIPKAFQIMSIQPNQPFEPFQRRLRQTLKNNGVQIISETPTEGVSILTILSQGFSERTTAYGNDGQTNRTSLQFQVSFQIIDSKGNIILPNGVILVQRELSVNPNAILSTDVERNRLKNDLYNEAASQLIRQLSFISTSSKE